MSTEHEQIIQRGFDAFETADTEPRREPGDSEARPIPGHASARRTAGA